MKPRRAAASLADHAGGGPIQEPAATATSAGAYQTYLKPLLDRLAGAVLLIMALPILLPAAALAWHRIGRPVVYRQPRIGKHGTTFDLYKLRTMIHDRRQNTAPYQGSERRRTHKSPDDPRVLPFGRALRRWRLDELPQLWNVVKGDMSLVGPRPELPEIVAIYEDWQHNRHTVKPGITGLWQISDQNGKLMHECTELDIEYVQNITFGRDVAILLRTPAAMVGKHRGY